MMENTREQIADMLSDMQFERRPAVSRQKKAHYAAMEAGVAEVLKELNRLHLRLWHAASQRDYHSLSLDEARTMLDEVRCRLDVLSKALES